MRAVLRATQIGLFSHIPFFLCVNLVAPRLGGGPAILIGISGSLCVALTLGLLRRAVLRRQAVKSAPA